VYVAGGTRLPLPTPVARALELRTDELATIIDHLYQTSDIKHHEGAIGILTNGLVHRIDIFEHIVKLLLGQYQVKNGGMN
jgi:non-canonical (house-cleaning) NTP pyrophosphatase